MADAKRDANRIPVLIGASDLDGETPVMVYVDPSTHELYVKLSAGDIQIGAVEIKDHDTDTRANVSNCLDGRYIYSMRPTSGILDRYDIASKAWLATTGVTYLPTLTLGNGSSSFWDARYIYFMVQGTAAIPVRIYKYNIRGNYMEPFAGDWYLGGVAVVGDKLWVKDLSATGTVRWVYYMSGTSAIVRRIMII